MQLRKALKTILFTSSFAGVLNLISFYAFFQTTDVLVYGQAVFYISGFSLVWAVLTGFDTSLSRLVHADENEYAGDKLLSVVKYKIAALFLFNILTLIIYSAFIAKNLIEINDSFIALIWLKVNTFAVYTLVLNALIATRKYLVHRTAVISFAVSNLVFTLVNVFYFDSSVFLWILFEIGSAIFALILVIKLRYLELVRELVDTKIRLDGKDKKFIANLSFNSFLGAIKQHILLLVLGSLGLYTLVAQLNAVKYIFDFVHNFLANTVQKLYPIFMDYKDRNTVSFRLAYICFSIFRLLISIFIFIFLTKIVMPGSEILVGQSAYSINFVVLIFIVEFSFFQSIQTVFVAYSYLNSRADLIWKNGIVKVISQISLLFLIVFLDFKYALIYVGMLSTFCCFLHIVLHLKFTQSDELHS